MTLKYFDKVEISVKQKDENSLFTEKDPAPIALAHKIDKIPRYYQINGVNKLNYYINQGHKRVLMILPTGTGKTLLSKLIVLSKDIRKTLNWQKKKKIRVLFVTHKNRLLRQAKQEFASCGDIELITQSAFQSVPNHVVQEGWDITFIDEAHHEAMMSIQKLLDELGDIPIVGFTATPERGDSLLIKFEKFIVPISKREAIEEGYISEPGINIVLDTGRTDKTDLAISLINQYRNHMGNTIVFFKTNKECEKLHDWCLTNNISSKWLSASSSEKDLDEALDELSKGNIQFLINCKKIDEGIDVLNCTDVILARQFYSKSEKEQLIGRCIRPDSPSVVWEFQNPYVDSVEAYQVIGSYRFRRLLYVENKTWNDKLIEGVDKVWGYGEKIRFEYIKENLGYDPRVESELDAINRKQSIASDDAKHESIPDGGFLVSHKDASHPSDLFAKVCVNSFVVKHGGTIEPERKTITRRLIYNSVDSNLKDFVMNCTKKELITLAKELQKNGVI